MTKGKRMRELKGKEVGYNYNYIQIPYLPPSPYSVKMRMIKAEFVPALLDEDVNSKFLSLQRSMVVVDLTLLRWAFLSAFICCLLLATCLVWICSSNLYLRFGFG